MPAVTGMARAVPTLEIPKDKKKTALLTIGVLFEVNEDELHDDYNTIDYFEENTDTAIQKVMSIYKKHPYLGGSSSRVTLLDTATMNCGQCAVCEVWVTDMEKPQPILEFEPGVVRDGRLICEDHLPEKCEPQ